MGTPGNSGQYPQYPISVSATGSTGQSTGNWVLRVLSRISLLPLLLWLPVHAQRAQLAHQGRRPESGRPAAVEPIRKLPRRPSTLSPNPDYRPPYTTIVLTPDIRFRPVFRDTP